MIEEFFENNQTRFWKLLTERKVLAFPEPRTGLRLGTIFYQLIDSMIDLLEELLQPCTAVCRCLFIIVLYCFSFFYF